MEDETGTVDHEILILKNQQLQIVNTSKGESCFLLKAGGGYFSNDEITAHVRSMPDDIPSEALERKAWRFVIDNIEYLPSITGSRKIHHPLTLINSIGFGQCDDLSASLYFIWKSLGFKARVWELGGHVVPEVYADGKWQMYDPSFQAYYLNNKGEIASVEELVQNQEYILEPREKISAYTFHYSVSDSFKSVYDSLKYSDFINKYYATTGNNKPNEWYENTFIYDRMKFCLPSGASLKVPVYADNIINFKDWFGNESEINYFIKVEFPANSNDNINLPLVFVQPKNMSAGSVNQKNMLLISDSLQTGNLDSRELFALINNNYIGDSIRFYFRELDTNSVSIRLLNN